MKNSKKTITFLSLGEDELLAVAVQKYLWLYDESHRSHKEKNVVQNAWEVVATEWDFAEDGITSSAIFNVFIDYIFYPFLPNFPFQYPGITVFENPYKFPVQHWKEFEQTYYWVLHDTKVIAAESRFAKTTATSFYKKHKRKTDVNKVLNTKVWNKECLYSLLRTGNKVESFLLILVTFVITR